MTQRNGEADRIADALGWREHHLPELTPERVKALKRAGFDPDRLRHLARTKHGRSLAVSVLICFTDAYPQQATTADIARAGEAARRITTRSAEQFEAALAEHGLTARHLPTPSPRTSWARNGHRASRTRTWLGWFLVAFLALALTSGLAALDLGFGAVFGAIWLFVAWHLVVRRVIHGRAPVPNPVRRRYLVASLGFVVASFGAADALLVIFGAQGVGRIDIEWQERGTHNTPSMVCQVQQPDGAYQELRGGSACPAPMGTPVTMVYLPGDGSGAWRPVLGTKASLAPMTALWGVGTLVGCGLMLRQASRQGAV